MPTQYFTELSAFTDLPNDLQTMVGKIEKHAGLGSPVFRCSLPG
jgi:hypothetical protein